MLHLEHIQTKGSVKMALIQFQMKAVGTHILELIQIGTALMLIVK